MSTAHSNLGSPSNPAPQLPRDVYALIVDECAMDQDLRPSLKNLSLTQSFLLPLCQRHLFRTVFYRREDIEKLIFFSDVSPNLIDYIRSFHYNFSGNDDIVLRFMQKLRRINTFSFAGEDDKDDEDNPFTDFSKDVDPQLAAVILNLTLSPDLKNLSLRRVDNYPMQYLAQVGNLENLRFLNIKEFGTDAVAAPTIEGAYAPSARLSDLRVGPRSGQAWTALVGGFMSPAGSQPNVDFSSVRDLNVEFDEQADIDGAGLVIQACTGLEELVCAVDSEASQPRTFEGFANFILSGPSQTLRKVQFFAPIIYNGFSDFSRVDFPLVKEQVKQLSDSHKLVAFETLIVSLDIQNVDSTLANAKRLYAELEAWLTEMDSILGQDPGFPSFQQFSVTVYITCTVPAYRYDEEQGEKLVKIYKPMAGKLRRKCFNRLAGLGVEVEFEFELDLPDWDMMYMTF